MKKESPVQNSRVSLLVLSCVLLIAGVGILRADEANPDVTLPASVLEQAWREA